MGQPYIMVQKCAKTSIIDAPRRPGAFQGYYGQQKKQAEFKHVIY